MIISSYLLLKFLHVIGAILWVGGISTLTILYSQLGRAQESTTLTTLLRVSGFAGRVIVGPAAAITLIAGIATAVIAGFDFGMLWITWGFMGILLSILLGATLIRSTTAGIAQVATAASLDTRRLQALQGRLAGLNVLNLLILLSTVGAMVIKPTL